MAWPGSCGKRRLSFFFTATIEAQPVKPLKVLPVLHTIVCAYWSHHWITPIRRPYWTIKFSIYRQQLSSQFRHVWSIVADKLIRFVQHIYRWFACQTRVLTNPERSNAHASQQQACVHTCVRSAHKSCVQVCLGLCIWHICICVVPPRISRAPAHRWIYIGRNMRVAQRIRTCIGKCVPPER